MKFTGKEIKAPLSGKKCVYFETAIFYDNGTSTGHYHTQDRFIVRIDGREIELNAPPARLYLQPTFEKEYDTKKAPARMKEIFDNIFHDEMPEKVIVKEWALLPDKEYIVKIKKESYYLPPVQDSDEPSEHEYTMYEIMDKEYDRVEKEKYETPASHWIGG